MSWREYQDDLTAQGVSPDDEPREGEEVIPFADEWLEGDDG